MTKVYRRIDANLPPQGDNLELVGAVVDPEKLYEGIGDEPLTGEARIVELPAAQATARAAEDQAGASAAALDATLRAIEAHKRGLLRRGAPAGEKFVAVDDGSRADMGGMATTALAAVSQVVAWPDSYAEGWIATDNTRIALTTPADGLALAASVGDWYAQVVQHARDLKDDALDGQTVDPSAGWPG